MAIRAGKHHGHRALPVGGAKGQGPSLLNPDPVLFTTVLWFSFQFF